jgi:hypothetical protein
MDSEQPVGWHGDPYGRHEQRYWDGASWTEHVLDGGVPGVDPPAETLIASAVAATATRRARKRRGGRILAVAVLLVLLAGVAGVLLAGGGDDDEDSVEARSSASSTTSTRVERSSTSTTDRPTTTTTSTTQPLDPTDVVGANLGEALPDLREAGIEARTVEVIDESVPDGQIVAAEEQPDGSVVLTVARPPTTRFLDALAFVDRDSADVHPPPFNISGTTYTHGVDVYVGCTDGFVEYDLGRDFRRFRATSGMDDGTASGTRARVEISLDGQIVSTNDIGLGDTIAIDLDVTGALRLRIAITTIREDDCAFVGFGDGRLEGVPSEVPPEN